MAHAARFALWNLEWAPAQSARGEMIRQQLNDAAPDVVCLTESHASFLGNGRQIEAEADYGYPLVGDRRKVLLWSRASWANVDAIGSSTIPGGRFVRGQTETPIGIVTVIGICIPWNWAHVRSGRRNAQQWQEHRAFLDGLKPILDQCGGPTIVLGDFNQTVPRTRQPASLFNALSCAFGPRLQIATADCRDLDGRAAIDHLAHTNDLSSEIIRILPTQIEGLRLSDHFGMVVDLGAGGR